MSNEDTFTCPECHRVSHNPNDRANGWCGACNRQTEQPNPPGRPTERRRVIGAAIKQGDKVYSIPPPKRHNHIIEWMADLGVSTRRQDGAEQGFILDDRTFVTRDEALVIVRASGQLNKPLCGGKILTSEDLW